MCVCVRARMYVVTLTNCAGKRPQPLRSQHHMRRSVKEWRSPSCDCREAHLLSSEGCDGSSPAHIQWHLSICMSYNPLFFWCLTSGGL